MDIIINLYIYIKDKWPVFLLLIIVLSLLKEQLSKPYGLIVLLGTVAMFLIGSFLNKKLLKLESKGPIPWYGSPIIWLGAIFTSLLVYWLVFAS